MRIVILSRQPDLYSTRELVRAAEGRGHTAHVRDTLKFDIRITRRKPELFYEGEPVGRVDAVVPRVGGGANGDPATVAAEPAIEVPDVIGMLEGDAFKVLMTAGLEPSVQYVIEADAPVGRVLETIPAAGAESEDGEVVFVVARSRPESDPPTESDLAPLARFETIRAHGALRMGLIKDIAEAASRQHTPKIAFVAPPKEYVSSSGKRMGTGDIDVLVRALSMGKLHHAMMGTASVAIATAAAVPGTLVNLAAGGGERDNVCFGHPSGTLRVGAQAQLVNGEWKVTKAIMSRSARVLMEGRVHVPREGF